MNEWTNERTNERTFKWAPPPWAGGRWERRWVKRWGTHQGNSAGRVLRPRCMQFVGRWLPGATGKSPRFANIDLEEWQKSKQSPAILHAKNNGFGKCEERTDWISRNASWMDLSLLLALSYCWLNHMKEKKREKTRCESPFNHSCRRRKGGNREVNTSHKRCSIIFITNWDSHWCNSM